MPTRELFPPSSSRYPRPPVVVLALLLAAGAAQGQTPASFGAVNAYSAGAYSQPFKIAVADVNGDGRLDIVTANYGTSTAGTLLGLAGGGFTTVSTFSTGTNSGPTGIAVADVNRDGRPDLVTANYGSNSVGVLLGLAGGGFAAVSIYPTSANSGPTSGLTT